MAGNIVSGPEVGHWVSAQQKRCYVEQGSQAIGLLKNGQLVAGAIFENWNQRSIVLHIAITGNISKEFLKILCGYAFDFCKVHKVIGPIESTNHKSIKIAKKFGFVEEARLTDAAPNGDIILFTLTKNQCIRFLGA